MPIAQPDAWVPVYNWLQRNYPRPAINKDWLKACVEALQAQAQADPTINNGAPLAGPALFRAAETQLLLSHLGASCLPHTGLWDGEGEMHDVVLFPTGDVKGNGGGGGAISPGGCLVMILRIDEIGSSAFSLQTTMGQRREVISGAGRIRRLRDPGAGAHANGGRGGGQEGEEEDEYDDDPGRLPAYPRGMLMLEVTDGHTVMRAMEYKRISGLVLGETMLGSKMILRNVRVLRNILQLTPECVTLKGHCVEELEAIQGRLFENGLRRRMGKEELPVEGEDGEAEDQAGEAMHVDAQAPAPAPAPAAAATRPVSRVARANALAQQELEGAAAFLDPEEFFNVDDLDEDLPPRRTARAPSRQNNRQLEDAPPPPKKRLTIPPKLAINAEAGPSAGRRTRPPAQTELAELDDDFSMFEPTAEELEEIMRVEAGGSGASGQKQSGAKDDLSAKPPSQSKYFGQSKGKAKSTRSPNDQRDATDDDIDMDAGQNAIAPRRRTGSRGENKSRMPLFMSATQIDSDTEEDSQKENRPVKGAKAGPVRAPSRGGGASREKGGEGERIYREVIELSD